MVLVLLDWLLFCLHLVLVLFNLFGWMHPKTRAWHFWTILGTWVSWIGLGFWYGFGYCPLTQWHWELRQARGLTMANNYIKHLIDTVFAVDANARWVDVATVIGAIFALCMAFYFRFRKLRSEL